MNVGERHIANRRQTWGGLLLGTCAALGLCLSQRPVAEGGQARTAEPVYRRWAILATPAVEETGFVDLLTARLSEQEDLELIERQDLQRITAELELAAALAPQAAAQRLELGRLVGADGLLLLSLGAGGVGKTAGEQGQPGAANEKPFLKLVICECHYSGFTSFRPRAPSWPA